jgi:hypothetical protein
MIDKEVDQKISLIEAFRGLKAKTILKIDFRISVSRYSVKFRKKVKINFSKIQENITKMHYHKT